MVTLNGLPGMKAKTKAAFAGSRTDAIAALREHAAVTSAGDDGAINVWQQTDGTFRCQFCQWMSVKNSTVCPSLRAVREWMKVWWERMRR